MVQSISDSNLGHVSQCSMSSSFGWSRIFILLLIRSQTSLAVARATCSQLTARPASPPRRSLSAGAGTPVLRTATVRTTAMPTAPVRSCNTDNHSTGQGRTITLSGSGISLNDSTLYLSMMCLLVITDPQPCFVLKLFHQVSFCIYLSLFEGNKH